MLWELEPLFWPNSAEGAVDWMVVRVVVKDCCEWFGDEKVLSLPPSCELMPPPTVLLVPAFDCPASECIVSGFVARVGAADLLLTAGA